MKLLNTFPFEPTFTDDSNITVENAEKRGQIFIYESKSVVKGFEIVDMIKDTPNETFLVSKPVFDHLKSLGFKNVAMFDPALTVYDGERVIAQGGVLLS